MSETLEMKNGRLRWVIIASGVLLVLAVGLGLRSEWREKSVGPRRDSVLRGVGELIHASGTRDSAITALASAVANNTVSIDSLWREQKSIKAEVYELRSQVGKR